MSQAFSISAIFQALLRRFWMIFAITVLGTAGAVAYALSRPAIFEATAVIQIEMAQIEENLAVPGTSRSSAVETRLKLIEQKLMSRDSLIEVIEKYDLFAGDPSMSMAQKVGLFRGAAQIQQLLDPEQAWRPNAQPSGLIITVRMEDAQLAADVANDLLSRVLIEGKSRRSGRAARTLAFFEAEEARVGTEIATLEEQIATYKTQNRASLPSNLVNQQTQLTRLKESQLEIEQQLIELQTQSDRRRAEDLQRQTTLLRQQQLLLEERIVVIERALAAAPEVERQLGAMERQMSQLQEELSVITTRRTEAAMNQQLESQNQFERFEVLETAIVPEYPVSSGRRKLAMAGAMGSGMLAVGLALGLEFMSAGIRSASQLERELNMRPVVVIPKLDQKKAQRRRRLGWIAGLLALIAGAVILLKGQAQDLLNMLNIFRKGPRRA
ncbi:Wzz/FepE/Etk N-terminal domain-containing protein [Thalassobius sp. S69A]|uniref:Wzz/FepE/Etk N-terminal domain-containing protein n=1 Tax=unclassified Thalassovita TaxID=2619711 RepID=UPI000C111CCA|nr:chain-length determining protein [Paracoccaceae bacterium]MBT27160.1 chain-length determining protein [Paracoccaceae bacterium]